MRPRSATVRATPLSYLPAPAGVRPSELTFADQAEEKRSSAFYVVRPNHVRILRVKRQ